MVYLLRKYSILEQSTLFHTSIYFYSGVFLYSFCLNVRSLAPSCAILCTEASHWNHPATPIGTNSWDFDGVLSRFLPSSNVSSNNVKRQKRFARPKLLSRDLPQSLYSVAERWTKWQYCWRRNSSSPLNTTNVLDKRFLRRRKCLYGRRKK